jgi:hypothetical protein
MFPPFLIIFWIPPAQHAASPHFSAHCVCDAVRFAYRSKASGQKGKAVGGMTMEPE